MSNSNDRPAETATAVGVADVQSAVILVLRSIRDRLMANEKVVQILPWAVVAGLALHVLVVPSDVWIAPLSNDSLLRLIALVAVGAAIFDITQDHLYSRAVAGAGAIFFVGQGIASFLYGPGLPTLLLVVADGLLVVGVARLLWLSSDEPRTMPEAKKMEIITLCFAGAAALFGLLRSFAVFDAAGTLGFLVLAVVSAAAIGLAIAIRTLPSLLMGGGAALLYLMMLFGGNDSGGATILLQLCFAGMAGFAGWQFWKLGDAPIAMVARRVRREVVLANRSADAPGTGHAVGHDSSAAVLSTEEYAGFGARFGALFIDNLVLAIPTVIGWVLVIAGVGATSVPLALFGFAVLVLGDLVVSLMYLFQLGRTGQTWGRRSVGIHVVNERTGQPLGIWTTIGRNICSLLSMLVFGLGYLNVLWDPKRQAWHDKIVGSVVVRDPSRLTDQRRPASVEASSGSETLFATPHPTEPTPTLRSVVPPPQAAAQSENERDQSGIPAVDRDADTPWWTQ